MQNKTYILDTNVYGELLIERNSEEIIKKLEGDSSLYIYGIDIIKKELGKIPAEVKYQNKLFKEAVLSLYKSLVEENLKLFPLSEHLASEYYKKFNELRKSGKYYRSLEPKIKKYTEDDLKIDFQIIAMASLKNIDIVISTDKRTILSEIAENTYSKINNLNDLRTPKLIKYSEFIRRYFNE